jgi:hypothetical protein
LWWSDNAVHFPIVSELARKFLAVPASQCTTERTFSTSGNIVTPKRSRLKPALVEKLAILQKNKDIFALESELQPVHCKKLP